MRPNLIPYCPLILALMLTGLLMGLGACGYAGTSDNEHIQAQACEGVFAPRTVEDSSTSTKLRTEWACVTFGSYPQTEIVREAFDAVDAYALEEGDALVDPSLFDMLEQATWTNDECEMDGERYRRITTADASSWATDEPQHYRWEDEDAWHYFRYEPICWRVGALDGTCALLFADRLLDCQPYNADEDPVTWETSTIRSWLNGLGAIENTSAIDYRGTGFVDVAFSEADRHAIMRRTVANEPNAFFGTSSGPDTEDRVFLLSGDEAFASKRAAELGFYAGMGVDDPARRFRSTLFAKCRGAWWSPVDGYCGNSFWLMRTTGYTPTSVGYICDFGYVYSQGTQVTCADAGILPALWCNLSVADWKAVGSVASTDIIKRTATSPDKKAQGLIPEVGNPIVVPDENETDGKRVSYSTLAFGSFPQTEIVGNEADANAFGTTEVDAGLEGILADADWSADETVVADQRYLRTHVEGEETRYFRIEPIDWRVLEVSDGAALLLADRALDCVPFNEDMAGVTWETCTLRSYLNGLSAANNAAGIDYTTDGASFLGRAFTPQERQAICRWPTRNLDNHYFGTDCGPDTVDAVFLLAESEVFGQGSAVVHGFAKGDEVADRARRFQATGYARSKGVWTSSQDSTAGNVAWMLRTCGYTKQNVVYADENGYLYNRGMPVTCKDLAVVPALRVDLTLLTLASADT